jgi:hypothetical protein
MTALQATDYLTDVTARLSANKFECTRNVGIGDWRFDLAARRTRLELTKFGFAETFFVFGLAPEIDGQALAEFSNASWVYAMNARKMSLPVGMFESVFSFAVAVVPSVDAALAEVVRNQRPERHFSSFEMPVIVDLSARTLHYFEKTGVWGFAYFAGFRKLIRKQLAP